MAKPDHRKTKAQLMTELEALRAEVSALKQKSANFQSTTPARQVIFDRQPFKLALRNSEAQPNPILSQPIGEHQRVEVDRQSPETASRERQGRLNRALELTQTIYWEHDLARGQLCFTGAIGQDAQPLQLSYEQALTTVHPDDRERVDRANRDAIAALGCFQIEHRLFKVGQSDPWRWMMARGQVLTDTNGSPTRMIGVSVDITDLKQTEAQLRRNQLNLVQAQRLAHLGHWEYDVISQQVTWSEEIFQIFGWPSGQAGPTYEEALQSLHPDDVDLWKTHVERTIAAGIPCKFDCRIVRSDGSWRYVEVHGETLHHSERWIIRLFGTVLDVTERKRAELELQQAKAVAETASQAKSLLLAHISHELRTPLNVILGYAQLLSQDASLSPVQRESLSTIHRNGDYLLSLLNHVVSQAKTNAGNIQLPSIAPLSAADIEIATEFSKGWDVTSVNESPANSVVLQPADLQVMPIAWIAALYQAALNCYNEEVDGLIQQIPVEHTALTTGLKYLNHDYQFDVIMQLCQLATQSTG